MTTNVTDGSLLEKLYTEKISSRLSSFVPCRFLGEDIRTKLPRANSPDLHLNAICPTDSLNPAQRTSPRHRPNHDAGGLF